MDAREMKAMLKLARDAIRGQEYKETLKHCKVCVYPSSGETCYYCKQGSLCASLITLKVIEQTSQARVEGKSSVRLHNLLGKVKRGIQIGTPKGKRVI